MAVHLAVTGDVFDCDFLCCLFFPRDVLDEIWELIGSVSEGFPTYSCNFIVILLLVILRRLFCFGSLVVLDVVYGYVLLFLFDIILENR